MWHSDAAATGVSVIIRPMLKHLPLRAWFALCFLVLLAVSPTSQPAAGTDTSIAGGQYHFPAPPPGEWTAVNPDPAAQSITFLNGKHDGAIQLVLLNKDASVDPDIAMNVAVAIVKELKRSHTEHNDVVILQPRIEKDRRFAVVIHEKYKVGDKTADQMHIYKSVGPRVLMLTVNSVADDPAKTISIHAAAEQMLDAARFNRKAFKRED
jgi:hypothetical protein